MLKPMKFVALFGAMLAVAVCAGAGGNKSGGPDQDESYLTSEFDYHAVNPLGVESLMLEPSKKLVNLMVSATSPEFEGLRRLPSGRQPVLVNEGGKQVRQFPESVTFRVTASTGVDPVDPDPLPTKTELSPEDYLLHLHFRLKIFHHLDSWTLEPQSSEMIGMPADVAYNERIYLVRFNLQDLPAEDRVMLEVFDDSGQRVTHFHLELL
jgi:hypothetical protein